MIPAITKAMVTLMINSLLFEEDEDVIGTESRTQTSFSRTVPGPHLSSRTQTSFSRTVPGPHSLLEIFSTIGSSTIGSSTIGSSTIGSSTELLNTEPIISKSSVPEGTVMVKLLLCEVAWISSEIASSPSARMKKDHQHHHK